MLFHHQDVRGPWDTQRGAKPRLPSLLVGRLQPRSQRSRWTNLPLTPVFPTAQSPSLCKSGWQGPGAQLSLGLPRRPRPRPQLPVWHKAVWLPLSCWVPGHMYMGHCQPYETAFALVVSGKLEQREVAVLSYNTPGFPSLGLQEHELSSLPSSRAPRPSGCPLSALADL